MSENKVENFSSGIFVERKRMRIPNDMKQMHIHNYHELYFLLSGKRRYFIGHTIYDVSAGDLVVIPKDELHRTTNISPQGYDRYLINFSDEYLALLRTAFGAQRVDTFLKSGCIQLPTEKREEIKQMFASIEHELSAQNKGAHLMVTGKLNELIITAIRHGIPKQRESEKTVDRIQKVAQYVSSNYQNPITLSEAAKMAYLEEAYFSKQFKKITGFCFAEYLTQVRMKKALALLSQTTLSVSEVALECGFSGGNYFGDVFHRIFGMSPSEYRKRNAV